MLGLIVATAIVCCSAILLAASFRPRSFTGFLLAVYVLSAGEVVVLTELLSLVRSVGARGYLIGELVVLLGATLVWTSRARPMPPRPRIRLPVHEHPMLACLALAVAIAISYEAFVGLSTPPSNWDSMVYHLARAAEWSQRGAVDYYPHHSESVNVTQPNAEMLILYTFTFAGRETFAAAPQLLAQIACLAAVYGTATRLGFSRPASLFAALLTGTLTQVALQSVTTQNDLVTASFVATALYFVLGRVTWELALAGLAIGIAVGTKATAVMALPILLLAAALTLDRNKLLRAVGVASACIAVFGAYGYVLNLVHNGNLLGSPSSLGGLTAVDLSVSGTVSTAARMTYDFVDVSGYPRTGPIVEPVENAAERLFDVARIPTNPPGATLPTTPFDFEVNARSSETRSYFGPLGALLLLPLSAGFLVAACLGRVRPVFVAPALALPFFLVCISVTTVYNEFNGRYFMPAIALTMPLAAWLYSHRGLAAAAACVGVFTLLVAHLQNELKPVGLGHNPSVWSITRAQAQTLARRYMAPVVASLERQVPRDARLGYVLHDNDWVFPLYGPGLDRVLVQLPEGGTFDAADREGLDSLVITGGSREPPQGWRATRFPAAEWTIFVREPR